MKYVMCGIVVMVAMGCSQGIGASSSGLKTAESRDAERIWHDRAEIWEARVWDDRYQIWEVRIWNDRSEIWTLRECAWVECYEDGELVTCILDQACWEETCSMKSERAQRHWQASYDGKTVYCSADDVPEYQDD